MEKTLPQKGAPPPPRAPTHACQPAKKQRTGTFKRLQMMVLKKNDTSNMGAGLFKNTDTYSVL